MKIKFTFFVFLVICGLLFSALSLTGCDFLFGDDNKGDDDVDTGGNLGGTDGKVDGNLGGSLVGGNPSVFSQDAGHSIFSSVDSGMVYLYMAGFGSFTPLVMTYVNDDGSVSVCSATDTYTYVYEYSADLRHIKTIRFQNEFTTLGAFAKDDQGNYYFFYGKSVEENEKNTENTSLVKYDSSGGRVNTYRLKAFPENSNNGNRDPFLFGACRMEISGNMLAVYFARRMFQSDDGSNHQTSWGYVVDKDTFARVNIQIPYASHSFDQFILPINNGFMFADQGDAYPRGFRFTKVQIGQANKRLDSFRFKESERYQQTHAQSGGLAQTSDGYLFAGTYEKNNDVSSEHNDSRNVFVLTLDNDLNSISQPIWITDYRDKDNKNAAYPKIAALGAGRFLLMWELMGNSGYQSTYTAVIDKTGSLLTEVRELPGVRLSINDVLRYNRTNGTVYWAVDNDDKNINVFSFHPDYQIDVPERTGALGGGYGLTLRNFTVDKTTVSQYELLTVQATIRNSILDTFPGGQIGAALVNNDGDIVEVIGTTNISALNSGQQLSNRTVSCFVPDTASAGQYRLRIVIRPTGGEWRVATLTISSERRYSAMTVDNVPNAITVTVTAGVANSDGYGLALTNFTLNNGVVSAPPGGRFAISLRAVKAGVEPFPGGQIGVALVAHNGDMVDVIDTRNWDALESGSSRSQNMSTVTVPRTVAPGQYKLRVVARPTGEDWKILTMSADGVPTSIDFEVVQ
jgi:hypothetical protein